MQIQITKDRFSVAHAGAVLPLVDYIREVCLRSKAPEVGEKKKKKKKHSGNVTDSCDV